MATFFVIMYFSKILSLKKKYVYCILTISTNEIFEKVIIEH